MEKWKMEWDQTYIDHNFRNKYYTTESVDFFPMIYNLPIGLSKVW